MAYYIAVNICMCYVWVSATTAAEVPTGSPGLDPVAFIPSDRRHRGGLHRRANDGWRVTKRRKAVGAVLLTLALLWGFDRNLSKLAQLANTRACDVLEPFGVTARFTRRLFPGAAPVVLRKAWVITTTYSTLTV